MVYTCASFRNKVDRGLLPALSLVYTLAFIDAINLPIARREGVDAELVGPFSVYKGRSFTDPSLQNLLVDHRYFIISATFFLPYILCVDPRNFCCTTGTRRSLS